MMAKRMKLISEVEYDNLKSSNLPKNISQTSFEEKLKIGNDLLRLNSIPDDIKLALYSSIVKNMHDKLNSLVEDSKSIRILNKKPDTTEQSTMIEDSHNPMEEKNELTTALDEDFTSLLPVSVQKPALVILHLLKRVPGLISWNTNGECSFNGVTAHGSNISDLLSYVLRPNLKINPRGLGRFLHTLRVVNMPTSILGCKMRLKLQETSTPTLQQNATVDYEDEDVFATPIAVTEPRTSREFPKEKPKARRLAQNWEAFRRHSIASPKVSERADDHDDDLV